jgi:protein SCO1/2
MAYSVQKTVSMFRTVFSIKKFLNKPGRREGRKKNLLLTVSPPFRLSILQFALMAFICLEGCSHHSEKIGLPYYNTPDFTPYFINSKVEKTKKIKHVIARFSFEDQDGVIINNNTIKGKIHVAGFMFTSCGSICPKMTSNLSAVSETFSDDSDVLLLSYSVTPWIDNKEKLKQYKAAKNISNKNWHFLTGDKGKIYELARRSYFAEEDLGFTKDSTEFLHTEHIILVDRAGHIRGIYNGTLQLETEQLIKDIKTLREE